MSRKTKQKNPTRRTSTRASGGILRGAKGSRTPDLYNAIVRAADCSRLWNNLL
jgi:hypothetical protein